MSLKNTMLNERSQTQKKTCFMMWARLIVGIDIKITVAMGRE